jgi:hypothetical protein
MSGSRNIRLIAGRRGHGHVATIAALLGVSKGANRHSSMFVAPQLVVGQEVFLQIVRT